MGILDKAIAQRDAKVHEKQQADYAVARKQQDNKNLFSKLTEGLSGMFAREQVPAASQYQGQANQLKASMERESVNRWLNTEEGMAARAVAAQEYNNVNRGR